MFTTNVLHVSDPGLQSSIVADGIETKQRILNHDNDSSARIIAPSPITWDEASLPEHGAVDSYRSFPIFQSHLARLLDKLFRSQPLTIAL